MTTKRITITEAEIERRADAMVQRRLERSNRYRYAANAAEQADVEQEIEEQVWADLAARYEVA